MQTLLRVFEVELCIRNAKASLKTLTVVHTAPRYCLILSGCFFSPERSAVYVYLRPEKKFKNELGL